MNRHNCYGLAGEEVTVIRDAGGGIFLVRLCKPEGLTGFAVLKNELTNEPPATNLPAGAAEQPRPASLESRKTSAVRRSKRTQPDHSAGPAPGQGQGSLF